MNSVFQKVTHYVLLSYAQTRNNVYISFMHENKYAHCNVLFSM